MRWTVIFLVFANLSYFSWGSYHESRGGYWLPEESDGYKEASGERLILLAEISGAHSVTPSDMAGVKPLMNSSIRSGRKLANECLVVGPFANVVEVDELQQRLFAVGVSSYERADENSQQQDYWVHIPPLPSRDAAIRLLRELQAQRIDSFVITQGELANGISLGLFSRSESAKTVSRRLTDAGYGVAIKSLPRVPEQWWLEMDSIVENRLSSSFWDETADQFPELKKLKKSCKSIATSKEIL